MADGEPLQDDEAWRRRAEQLQTALDSRVVIEQAKGMLRERLGLPIDSAFHLLRAAARNSGQKLQALAAEVVGSFSTPELIVRELGRHPEVFLTMPRDERALETEEFFRRVNEAIAQQAARDGHGYVCECANPYCNEMIDVDAEDVHVLHSQPGFYVILPGHEIPEVEHVVLDAPTYKIVTKLEAS
jgi:ANTAR domain-containing protein